MHPINPNTCLKAILFIIACSLLINPAQAQPARQSNQSTATDTACRFGINSVHGTEGYDIASLGIGSYLDWGAVTNPSLPEGVEYIHVLRLGDSVYPATLANLPAWVENNPGGVWIVGNEPDTVYENQDGLLPEVYADRYYEAATIIRNIDRTALIGFGPVVQPTPIRIRYLQRAWNRLVSNAGSNSAASRLVDIWAIHSFILNEEPGYWGTGIPPGFENDYGDAVIITNFDDTHSIEIFQQRVIVFRTWMAGIGERNKPLWITEYGSLFPPIDPPGGPNYVNVSDELTTVYMLDTFNFLLTASNSQVGLPTDGNQLVQRWYWYSLNDHRYRFGGTIYNPDYPLEPYTGPFITLVGQNFIAYQQAHLGQPDIYPVNLSVTPLSFNHERTLGNYRLNITIGNYLFNDATCAQVRVYDGDPGNGGTLIVGPIPASAIKADNGYGKVVALWKDVQPLTNHMLYVQVAPIGVTDANSGNNLASFSVYLEVPKLVYLPVLHR